MNTDNLNQPAPYHLGSSDLPVIVSGINGPCSYVNGTYHIDNAAGYWSRPSPVDFTLTGFSGPDCKDSSGAVSVLETDLAPIQGIQMPDGTWTSGGAKLTRRDGYSSFDGLALNASVVTTTVVEQGPLEVVIKVSYRYVPVSQAVPDVQCPGFGLVHHARSPKTAITPPPLRCKPASNRS